MSEWWSYRPSDLIMFSPRAYFRQIESFNVEFWPLQIVLTVVGLGIAFLLYRARGHDHRIAGILLGLAWIFVGVAYLGLRLSSINWAATYAAYAFSLQGLALIAGCLAWPQCGNEGSPGLAAPLFAVATTVLYPLVNLIGGQDVLTAETFGLMPTPTAVATFGLLGVVHNRAFATVLAIIPLLWCLTIAATLNAMNLTTWLVPALLAATGAALATVPRHRCLKQWVRR